MLFERIETEAGIAAKDVEISIAEYPPCNWGFRGVHGDEAKLDYKLEF